MNVLSFFDGISCLQLALNRAGIKYNNYYASEIKKIAIKVTQYHFPKTIQIGDITKVSYKDGILYTETGVYKVGIVDLIGGGSPCQDFSLVRVNQNKSDYGLCGKKSSLFYEYLRLLKEINPRYFLLENVKMKKESKKQIDKYLGVEGIVINSNLVSYQNRERLYWTNIPNVQLPEDRHISFQDYKETDPEECRKYKLNKTPSRIRMWNNGYGKNGKIKCCENITNANKCYCLMVKQDRAPNSGLIECDDFCRYLTRKEIEQAQTLPIGYTDMLSYRQMQNVCGDGWTVDVIAHILSYMR